jgi:hypothetical protein
MPTISRSGADRLLAGFGAVVCCLLSLLAIPRFIASLHALYPEAVYRQFKQARQPLPAEVYEQSNAALQQALAWHETGEYRQMQAFFDLLQNSAPRLAVHQRQRLIRQARGAITHGLQVSPVDPYAWFRLAVVEQLLKAQPRQIIEALRLSMYAGRVEPDLLAARLAFAYGYRNVLDEEMLFLLKGQIRALWSFRKTELLAFASVHPDAVALIREALLDASDEWRQFSRELESYK